jgi:hypothetical protein
MGDTADLTGWDGYRNSESHSNHEDMDGSKSASGYWQEMWSQNENGKPAAEIFGRGESFTDVFNNDKYADRRDDNLYYPFASKPDWEMASFLLRSTLSMAAIDEFLSLELVRLFLLSFYGK